LDPEELQEVGLFVLLAIIWAMLMRSSLGKYQGIITLIIVALFVVGVSLVAYGFLLVRRTDKLVKRSKEEREPEGDA
jgi:uncharacterized membrane protein